MNELTNENRELKLETENLHKLIEPECEVIWNGATEIKIGKKLGRINYVPETFSFEFDFFISRNFVIP